jgi:hypothetical protein
VEFKFDGVHCYAIISGILEGGWKGKSKIGEVSIQQDLVMTVVVQ